MSDFGPVWAVKAEEFGRSGLVLPRVRMGAESGLRGRSIFGREAGFLSVRQKEREKKDTVGGNAGGVLKSVKPKAAQRIIFCVCRKI